MTEAGAMTGASDQRWHELLGSIAAMLPPGPALVLIDGGAAYPGILAGRLAATLNAAGRRCSRLPGTGNAGPSVKDGGDPGIPVATITLADGAGLREARRWDVVITLRTPPVTGDAGQADGEAGADIVIDLRDPCWPVVSWVAAPLAGRGSWYITETRAFFAARAATWDTKFGDDLPAYAAAIGRASLPRGGLVVDVGCGTGRALPALREAVGPQGRIVAVDLTPEMLSCARVTAAAAGAVLVLADARDLPLADATADAVFAAGLIMHLPDTEAGLRQLARITRPGGLLVVFHPSGRAARAGHHGFAGARGEPVGTASFQRAARNTGWQLTTCDEAGPPVLMIATRQ